MTTIKNKTEMTADTKTVRISFAVEGDSRDVLEAAEQAHEDLRNTVQENYRYAGYDPKAFLKYIIKEFVGKNFGETKVKITKVLLGELITIGAELLMNRGNRIASARFVEKTVDGKFMFADVEYKSKVFLKAFVDFFKIKDATPTKDTDVTLQRLAGLVPNICVAETAKEQTRLLAAQPSMKTGNKSVMLPKGLCSPQAYGAIPEAKEYDGLFAMVVLFNMYADRTLNRAGSRDETEKGKKRGPNPADVLTYARIIRGSKYISDPERKKIIDGQKVNSSDFNTERIVEFINREFDMSLSEGDMSV